jgi:hypothetical protein
VELNEASGSIVDFIDLVNLVNLASTTTRTPPRHIAGEEALLRYQTTLSGPTQISDVVRKQRIAVTLSFPSASSFSLMGSTSCAHPQLCDSPSSSSLPIHASDTSPRSKGFALISISEVLHILALLGAWPWDHRGGGGGGEARRSGLRAVDKGE